jgi:hypothetical protein
LIPHPATMRESERIMTAIERGNMGTLYTTRFSDESNTARRCKRRASSSP